MLVLQGTVLRSRKFVNKHAQERYRVEVWGDGYYVVICRSNYPEGKQVQLPVEFAQNGVMFEKVK